MAESDKEDPVDHPVSTKLRSETMAYALQSGVFNLGANFFEPYVNYRTQRHYSQRDPAHPGTYGNYTQNLAGEFAGDVVGCSTLILAEALLPQQLHTFSAKARKWVDPFYSSIAGVVFAGEEDRPDYQQRVDRWKLFQERNLVRSAIMGTSGIAANVLTQKTLIGNPSPTRVILKGKLLSSALTTGLGLAIRFAFPEQMKNCDSWVGKNIFLPLLKDGQSEIESTSHAEKVALSRRDEASVPAR